MVVVAAVITLEAGGPVPVGTGGCARLTAVDRSAMVGMVLERCIVAVVVVEVRIVTGSHPVSFAHR